MRYSCPAKDEADELALMMLAELLRAKGWPMRINSSQLLSSESLAEVQRAQPALVCIGFLAQGPLSPLRQLCKRLHSRFPQLPVVAGCWGVKDREKTSHQLTGLVQAVGWGLAETSNQVIQIAQVSSTPNTLQEASPSCAPRHGFAHLSSESLALSQQP